MSTPEQFLNRILRICVAGFRILAFSTIQESLALATMVFVTAEMVDLFRGSIK
jgi:hypothetical protein